MEDKDYRITLRIPSKKLKNELKKMAAKNGRSLNAEIIQALQNHIILPYMRVEHKEAEKQYTQLKQSNKK